MPEKSSPAKNNIIAVVGPTASGKSELAVSLARRFGGEIISCDSRQIYKGMDIGTGKVEGRWAVAFFHGREKMRYRYKGVPHYLIDFASPKKQYSSDMFKSQADAAISDIASRGKLPILCGGTMHWIDAVVYNQNFPGVPPNPSLRARLEKKSAGELFMRLKKKDPARAAGIDRHNKRRLVRALEIIAATGKAVPPLRQAPRYRTLWIGIRPEQSALSEKIEKRLYQRLRQGMLKEVQSLHGRGISWKRLESFGLEYKYCALHLRGKLSYGDMAGQLLLAIRHYAKRQMTWWKRNKDIRWISDPAQATELVEKFLG